MPSGPPTHRNVDKLSLHGAAFKDHFSAHAAAYAKYRPPYPETLFRYLASLTTGHDTAWDCATGSGQAAIGLTPFYRKIVATDASAEQLTHAAPHPQIRYIVMLAETPELTDRSVDLITVANALHWFVDFDLFYAGAQRTLKPGGVPAAWFFGNHATITPAVDAVFQHFYADIIHDYWPMERRNIDEEYRHIPFPLTRLATPAFDLVATWELDYFLGYLGTWSTVREYTRRHGTNPIALVRADFTKAWGNPQERKLLHWRLSLHIGHF